MTSWSSARTAAIPARATPYSAAAVAARFTARGRLASCRVPMAGSQRLQAPLKSTRPAACSPSANWPAARESPPRPCATTRNSACSPRPARISGQRRYPGSAARLVAAILLYRDAGFTLAEQKALMATRASTPGDRRQLMQRKLAELDEQIARAQAAREAIRHGLRCPHEDITQCPNFNAGVNARLTGQPLSRSHQQLHGPRFDELTDSC